MPRDFLARSFAVAIRKIETKISNNESPWSIVAGLVAAAYTSMRRLGWKASAYNSWQTASGFNLAVADWSAKDVKRLATRDAQDWLWRQAGERRSAYSGLRGMPLVKPITQLLAAKHTNRWTPGHKGFLRSIVADSWWGDQLCPLCGENNWSIFHALWSCPAVARFLREFGFSDEFLAVVRTSEGVPFFSTALLNDPALDYPVPVDCPSVVWSTREGHCAMFGAEAFGDGSAWNNTDVRLRRCGWCVCSGVQLITHSEAVADVEAHGPLVGPIQEVPLAEAFALLFFLRNCLVDSSGSLRFYTDCKWVSDSYMRGEEFCTHSTAVFAGTWKQIFALAREHVGGDLDKLSVIKIKGHASVAACGDDAELHYRRLGNVIADKGAKQGAEMHPSDLAIEQRSVDHALLAKKIGLYLASCAAWRRTEYGKEATKPIATPYARRERADRRKVTQHRICGEQGALRWRCISCLRTANSAAVLRRAPCSRFVLGRHVLWNIGAYTFCIKCGAFSRIRTYNLHGFCLGRPANDTTNRRLQRLKSGSDPLTGAFLGRPLPSQFLDEWEFAVSQQEDLSIPQSLA